MEINLLGSYPKIKRDYNKRNSEKTPEIIKLAKQFGKDFFDGDRKCGYGGYNYDGRWKPIVQNFINFYNLPSDCSILDIGCGKGFMVHDFKEALPNAKVKGIDISEYAIANAMEDVKEDVFVANAETLPFSDIEFDLVISINTIHNLPLDRCINAIKEINRITRKYSYITMDAWRNEEERENLFKWVLTAETMMHVNDWKKLFKEIHYTGDYWWFIAD